MNTIITKKIITAFRETKLKWIIDNSAQRELWLIHGEKTYKSHRIPFTSDIYPWKELSLKSGIKVGEFTTIYEGKNEQIR